MSKKSTNYQPWKAHKLFFEILKSFNGQERKSVKLGREYITKLEEGFRKSFSGRNYKAEVLLSFPGSANNTDIVMRWSKEPEEVQDAQWILNYLKTAKI